MAVAPILNAVNKHVTFLVKSTTTIQLSDMVANTLTEATPTAASITKMIVAGPWTIARGANVVWQTDSNVVSVLDFASMGITLKQDNGANVVCTTASSTATLIIQLNKETYANGSAGGPY